MPGREHRFNSACGTKHKDTGVNRGRKASRRHETIPIDECICIHGLPRFQRTNYSSSDHRCSTASNRETEPVQSLCGIITSSCSHDELMEDDKQDVLDKKTRLVEAQSKREATSSRKRKEWQCTMITPVYKMSLQIKPSPKQGDSNTFSALPSPLSSWTTHSCFPVFPLTIRGREGA